MRDGTWAIHATVQGASASAATFTNMPAADTFLFSSHRHVFLVDLWGMTYARLKVNKQATLGNTGAKLILRYSPVFSTTVSDYIDIGTSECSVQIDVINTYLDSGLIPLSAPQDEVYIAIIGSGGNGVLDPQFGNISVSFS